MIRKKELNQNWSNFKSVLFESLPKNLQQDQKEWLAYHWNLAVGKEIAEISIVETIAYKTLQVRVKDAEWLPVLKGLEKEIAQRLNSRAGKLIIKKIKLTA